MTTKTSSSVPAAQLRKIKKPMIERRRRERINECLNQLKTLVLEATYKDGSRYSKMEKADILEMTVSHLRTLHRRPQQQSTSDAEAPGKYMDGFKQCAVEVGRYFAVAEAASKSATASTTAADSTSTPPQLMIGTRLMRHLTSLLLLHQSPGVQRQRQNLHASLEQTAELFVKSVAVDDAESDSGSSSLSTETSPDRRYFFNFDEKDLLPVSFREQVNVVSQSLTIDNVKKENIGGEQPDNVILHTTERSNTPTTAWTSAASSSGNIAVPLYTPCSTSSPVPLVWSYPPTSSVNGASPIGNVAIDEFRADGPSVHPGSPRQADEVPIHRQLTLVANSSNSQQQQQMYLPSSGVFICSSGTTHSEKSVENAAICSFNEQSRVPICSIRKEFSSSDVVWRPW